MTVSAVVAVHNEARYLPYSLPTLKHPVFDELIFVLDRCSDASEGVLKTHADHRFHMVHKLEQQWQDSCSEAKHLGCQHASGDFIMMTDADVILDMPAITQAVHILAHDRSVDIVVIAYKFHTLFSIRERLRDEWLNLLGTLIRKLKLQPVRSGVFLMRKSVAHTAYIFDTVGQYDFLQQTHSSVALITHTLHLRPKRDKASQLRRGGLRRKLPQYSLLKILLVAFLQAQPSLLLGYIQTHT